MSVIVLSAGGTGGHLFPAQALAGELQKRGHSIVVMTDARFKNSSRPSSNRVLLSRRFKSRSTSTCTAIDAWSMPGIHIALKLCIRFQRIRMSCSVEPSACPMCSDPVTFGGGSVIGYGMIGLASSAWKKPFSIQNRSHRGSTSEGSYCLESADDVVTRRR